jgi:hypothetical protein
MKKFPFFVKDVDWLLKDSRPYAATGVFCCMIFAVLISSNNGNYMILLFTILNKLMY